MNFSAALADYFSDFFQNETVHIDWLDHFPRSYSVEAAGSSRVLREYVTGKTLCAFDFNVNARLCYGFDRDNNQQNLELWNSLCVWLKERALKGVLPALPEGYSPQIVQALRPGSLIQAQDDGTGKYSLPCRLVYLC